MRTHFVLGRGFSEETDNHDDQNSEDEEEHGKVHVLELDNPLRTSVFLSTTGRPVDHVQNHPAESNYEATHQTKESTLAKQTCMHIIAQLLYHCNQTVAMTIAIRPFISITFHYC